LHARKICDDLKKEGYEVEVVRDGDTASCRAREQAFDWILLDVMLPRMDGFEVCRQLRRGRLRTPILMLTARTQEAEKVPGLELGADDYVTKPYSPHELRACIKALLRRATVELPEVYQFGDVEVDFAPYKDPRTLEFAPLSEPSPDGQQLAFAVREADSGSKILEVLPAKGGNARDLLRGAQQPFPCSIA
jgi:two-component system alkaline phosphatase synthesis response regulator PhoP